MQTATRKTRTAIVQDVFSGYGQPEVTVQITRSKARAAGADGVQFYAPGWRPMCFRSMDSAVAKIERHPGFVRWAA